VWPFVSVRPPSFPSLRVPTLTMASSAPPSLAEAIVSAARGVFPSPGPVSVVAPPPHLKGAIVAFSGHTYVAADVRTREVMRRMGDDPLTGPTRSGFVEWLASAIGANAGTQDAVLVAPATGRQAHALQPDPTWASHDRAKHGARLRRDLRGWDYDSGRGIVLIGRGLCDRWELAYEAAADAPWDWTGAAVAARGLIEDGELLFAQVAPGHPRSLRATLAAGYEPIGSEILFS
jgi:hypothetical protein